MEQGHASANSIFRLFSVSNLPLSYAGCSAKVLEMGAMLSDVVFYLEDGRQVAPLHKAPWLGEPLPVGTPSLLAGLQGEW